MENKPGTLRRMRPNTLALAGAAGVVLVGFLAGSSGPRSPSREHGYPVHRDITTTVFWVGEGADESNQYIHNRSSTWVENWVGAYGGIDEPEPRCSFLPCGFTPKENPFYFALPYNDLKESCDAKPSQLEAPWYTSPPKSGSSIVKNRWIQINFDGKTAYAQWEDAGPFGEDDSGYVFGLSKPRSDAGLDVSPATAGYLGLDGEGQASWQFVPEEAVPDGPWRTTITRSPPDCAT